MIQNCWNTFQISMCKAVVFICSPKKKKKWKKKERKPVNQWQSRNSTALEVQRARWSSISGISWPCDFRFLTTLAFAFLSLSIYIKFRYAVPCPMFIHIWLIHVCCASAQNLTEPKNIQSSPLYSDLNEHRRPLIWPTCLKDSISMLCDQTAQFFCSASAKSLCHFHYC